LPLRKSNSQDHYSTNSGNLDQEAEEKSWLSRQTGGVAALLADLDMGDIKVVAEADAHEEIIAALCDGTEDDDLPECQKPVPNLPECQNETASGFTETSKDGGSEFAKVSVGAIKPLRRDFVHGSNGYCTCCRRGIGRIAQSEAT
jgi:hypothetical protein